MLSQTAEYALRAIVALAMEPGRPMTSHELAQRTQVPAGYLSKVMQSLGRAGLVEGQRGPRGGFSLLRALDEVSVLDVINAVDPFRRIYTCPLRLATHRDELCALHARLDEALESVERQFAETKIAELLADPREEQPLCDQLRSRGLKGVKPG